MKKIIGMALIFALAGCVTERRPMDMFMTLQNMSGPFVSQSFAERLAHLVIDEKYPKNIFSISGSGNVVDKGDAWWVTFDNSIAGTMATMIPRRLTVHIRKANGEILTIT
jgi:hypothetical protein